MISSVDKVRFPDLNDPNLFKEKTWSEKSEMRQIIFDNTTSEKNLPELRDVLVKLQSRLDQLTVQQLEIIETWCFAVGCIKEIPFVEFCMVDCTPRQLLGFAENCLCQVSESVVITDIQQQYYCEEKIEVLGNIVAHGPGYLHNYRDMLRNLHFFISKEVKKSCWDRWSNDYVVRKMIRWIGLWKDLYLP